MSSISIIGGAGNMGRAIAGIAVKSGASVQIVEPDIELARGAATAIGATAAAVGEALTGEIVVLAVPYGVVAGLMATYSDQLAGRIVVDITNPIDPSTHDSLVVPSDSSSAQQTAAAIPSARVLKAFNTTFAGTLVSGQVGGNPTTVLVAGDDKAAKDALMSLVTGGGVRALDAGALKRARELEALGFLQISLAAAGTVSWTGGFAVVE